MQITTIGLDIAKNVFQVHGIDAAEKVVVRKQLRRGQVMAFFKALSPCLIGMEACATAHYWARELTKLGHQVRLMPAKDVKAYVKRNKNDAADAEAICEAVRRPTMRLPIRWRGSPGRCWPRVGHTGRLSSRQRENGPGNGINEVAFVRSRTAGVMTTLMRNGRDRRSGEPVMGHATLERVLLIGTRSADYIRASGHNGCI
jgi:hypothetical protein